MWVMERWIAVESCLGSAGAEGRRDVRCFVAGAIRFGTAGHGDGEVNWVCWRGWAGVVVGWELEV